MKVTLTNLLLFFWYRVIGRFFWLFPVKKEKVAFQSFFGKGYGDNPKYILEELRKRQLASVEFVWFIKKGQSIENFPKDIKAIQRFTWRELYHLATAGIWIDNSRKHYGVCKRRSQFYMQTWHGGLGFKKIEKSANMGKWYEISAKHDSRLIDVMLSGSTWQTNLCKTQFWYDGVILESGLPREDIWFQNKSELLKNTGKIKTGILSKKKYVLYAPTFRDSKDTAIYNIDFKKVLFLLEQCWGGEWVALIRLHPNMADKSQKIAQENKVIDVTNYSDINQLILDCDLFISDYSSCVLDSIWAGKPGILYIPDISEYERERGFLISPKQYPLPYAETNEELQRTIAEFDHCSYRKKYTDFKRKFGVIDQGKGAQRAVDYILDNTNLKAEMKEESAR